MALAEIELCGELMIAASAAEAAGEERLSVARIDEVLSAVSGDQFEPVRQSVRRPGNRARPVPPPAQSGVPARSGGPAERSDQRF